jgi:pimeloyl-ACP methyl ester carboxylesterase
VKGVRDAPPETSRRGLAFGYVCRVGEWKTEAKSVSAGNGRVLEVAIAGPSDGMPLFSHHGTPGSAEMFDPLVEIGAERRIQHITYSRPGYGASGRMPGRSVADCIGDVVAIADALGFDRFYSVGASGGAPHSIACAALLPERVISAAAIASPAPVDAEGLDWTEGMGKENVDELAAVRASDRELEEYLEGAARSMLGTSAEQVTTALGDLISAVDRRALSGALGEFMVRELNHSLSSGVWGWFDDDRAILGDWGFDLADVPAPLSIWHGGQDRFVPIAHGEWLAGHLRADAHLRPDDGHLSLSLGSYGEIIDALLEQGANGK